MPLVLFVIDRFFFFFSALFCSYSLKSKVAILFFISFSILIFQQFTLTCYSEEFVREKKI